MSRAKQRRTQRRRGRSEAAYQAGMRAGPKMPGTIVHYYEVDATHSLMERSPRAARLGVVFGAVVFVLLMAAWLLGLLGG